MFQHDLNQKSRTRAAILNARNQGSAKCSAKGVDAERRVEAMESDNEINGDDQAGMGDDEPEVVELWTVKYQHTKTLS